MRGRRWLPVARLATVGAVVLAGALVMPAAKALWSATYNVSAPGWTAEDSPTVAVDRQGDRLLVWVACDGTLPACYHQVQARTMRQGGTMGPIQNLSPYGSESFWPEVDADDDGDATVVWQQDSRVVARRVTSSGALGPMRTLSPEIGNTPNVVVSPGGRALVAWVDRRNGVWRIMAQFFYPDGSLGPMHDFGASTADKPAVGIDRNGQAVVAWAAPGGVVARRIKPGYISPLTSLSDPVAAYGGFGMVRVGVDRDGDTLVSFLSGGGDRPRVWARRWSRTGSLGGVIAVSSSSDSANYHHAIATDLDGDSVLVWTRWRSDNQTEVLGRRISAAGAVGGATLLGLGDRPDLAVDDDGDGLLVWHTPGGLWTPQKVLARTFTAAGSFGAARTVSSDGRVPQADSSPTGRFSVVWQQVSYPYAIHAIFGP